MEIILYIFFLLAFVITALKNIRYGVFLVVASLPLYVIRFNIFFIPTTLLEMMIFSVFAVWLYKSFKNEIYLFKHRIAGDKISKRIQRYPYDIELVLLLSISLIAVLVGGFSKEAFGIWKAYFFDPALFYIVLINVLIMPAPVETKAVQSEEALPDNRELTIRKNIINLVIIPLSVSAFYISLIAVYQKLTGAFIGNEFWADEATRRVTSLFGYPNAVGLYLGPLVLLFVGWLMSEVYRIKALANNFKFSISNFKTIFNYRIIKTTYVLVVILLCLFAIFYARSEGALVGVAVAVFLFCLLANKRTRVMVIAISVVAVLGIMLSPNLKTYAWEKITLNDFSGNVRKLQWAETYEMLKDGRMVLGAGLSNYQKAIAGYHQEGFFFNKDRDPDFRRKIVIYDERYKNKYWQPLEIYLYPHNIILNFWSELGLAGLILFVWIMFKFFVMGLYVFLNNKIQDTRYKIQTDSSWKFWNCKLFRNSKLLVLRRGGEIRNWIVLENRYLVLGLTCAMVQVIIHGLVDVPYFKNDLALMFGYLSPWWAF